MIDTDRPTPSSRGRATVAAWVALAGSACGSSATPPSAPSAGTVEVHCYEGTASMMGQPSPALVRRTLDQPAACVIEEVTGRDPDGGYVDFHVTFAVTGDDFTVTERGGAFTGTGRFTAGEPWRWTAWESTTVPPEPAWTMTATDALDGATLRATKRLLIRQVDPTATIDMTFEEQFSEIACEAWEARRAALHAAPAPEGAPGDTGEP